MTQSLFFPSISFVDQTQIETITGQSLANMLLYRENVEAAFFPDPSSIGVKFNCACKKRTFSVFFKGKRVFFKAQIWHKN